MPCFRPLTAWRGPTLPSGKRAVVFKPSQSTGGLVAFPQKLPCGQCIGCRLDYSLDWATRCLFEKQLHKESCFITLTYDPEHFPMAQCCLSCKKELVEGSLHVCEFQRFMKRLRKEFGDVKIRFFHAGEYGEKFGRPHYHALLFGCDFADKVVFKVTDSGSRIFTSEVLSRVWGKGYASVGDVTFESAAYVARYCLKKVTGEKAGEKYDRLDVRTGEIKSLHKEYVTMSRRPGIAFGWFKRFKSDVYPHGYVVVRGGVKMPPPRYFDGLYELENPLDFKRIKLDRVKRCTKSEDVWIDLLEKFVELDANRDERLSVMELVKESRVKLLSKKLESGQ